MYERAKAISFRLSFYCVAYIKIININILRPFLNILRPCGEATRVEFSIKSNNIK